MSIYFILLFVLGLAFGSFGNVIISRYEPGESVFNFQKLKGRSRCPHCDKELRWFELIPLLSFLFQKGKCRECENYLSFQYPIIELVSGLIFSLVPAYLYNFYELNSFPHDFFYFEGLMAIWIIFFWVLLIVTEIDRRHYLIPNELNVFLAGLGGLIIALKTLILKSAVPFHNSFLQQYYLITTPFESIWANHIFGALIASGFFVLLILLSGGSAMGWGDVKFTFSTGLALGWPDMGLSLVLAFIMGGVVGAYLLLTDQKTMKGKIPFGPFISLGIVLTFFFGFELVHNYLVFLGL